MSGGRKIIMVFNSYIYIFLFLPLTVIGYFLLNKYFLKKNGQIGLIWILVLSLIFYAYDMPIFLLLFLGSIFGNYWLGKVLTSLKRQEKKSRKQQKGILTVGIFLNLVPLAYFKYGDFFVDSIEDFFHAEWNVDVALPLGISFFTFLQIAYIVDCYRTEKGFDYKFIEYAVYAAFFPKIIMGPIVLHDEIIPQLREEKNKQPNYNNLSIGLYIFTLGLAKKILLADNLAKFVNAGYTDIYSLNSMSAIVVSFMYTLQLYFDFSGYCDMAMGSAKMLNIELPVNFNSPYKAKSITEFWERWHMTLTRFFTRYVYIPLGGSRKGKIRTYVNTMIVFLLSGLWHGAEWNFVYWGFLHGFFMVVEKIGKDLGAGLKKISGVPGKILDGIRWLTTFLLVNFAWIYFRAPNLGDAKGYIDMVFSKGTKCQFFLEEVFGNLIEVRFLKRIGFEGLLETYFDITIWIILLLLIAGVAFLKNTQEKMRLEKYNWKRSVITVALIVWCIISLSDVSEFLYFNF